MKKKEKGRKRKRGKRGRKAEGRTDGRKLNH
jgi:hypothetical protein